MVIFKKKKTQKTKNKTKNQKIVISLSEYRIQRRIKVMEEKMSELLEEWGEEIKG
jgi:hypothetical protein